MAFTRFTLDELEPGVLYQAFMSGTSAAIVECGDLVEKLWSMLMLDPEEKLPWELPLVDIARNHVRGKDLPSTLGDVFYFQPGYHSYIARKIEITPSKQPSVSPPKFYQGEQEIALKGQLVGLCCAFANKVMLSLNAPQNPLPDYKVAVQRLKYQADWQDYQALTELVEDSLARWGRTGYELDVLRGEIAPKFSRKGISDLLALLMMVTGRGRGRAKRTAVAHDGTEPTNVYEHSHVDCRYFTALCGQRHNVRTEVLMKGKWAELPVNLDTIAVYPGTMFLKGMSVPPTVHRVVHASSSATASERASNVTLLLGAA